MRTIAKYFVVSTAIIDVWGTLSIWFVDKDFDGWFYMLWISVALCVSAYYLHKK